MAALTNGESKILIIQLAPSPLGKGPSPKEDDYDHRP
jgi:hypothetical protein